MRGKEFVDNELAFQSEIGSLLLRWSRDRARFIEEVESLRGTYGNEVLQFLLFTTAHLKFSARTASRHWKSILLHWEEMGRMMKKDVDLRVALLDYFVDVNRRIKNPKIIEVTIFEKTLQDTFVDELTELYNYRFFMQALHREITRANRYGHDLSLVMYDVDDFKHYNDVNGHPEGSKALRKLAGILKKSSRDVDVVSRYGGEEFAVILPETGKAGALAIAERSRQMVERSAFRKGELQPLKRLTLSGGVAALNVDAKTRASLISKADQALYRAKSLGKNRIIEYKEERRRFPRVNGTVRKLVSVVSDGGDRYVARNISEGGLLLQTTKAPLPGENLALTLNFKAGDKRVPLTARIRRVGRKSRKYEIGASIVKIQTEKKKILRDFVRSLVKQ